MLAQALEIHPDNWLALSTLADRRQAKERDFEALELLQRAAASAPWHPEPALKIGNIYICMYIYT
jgi:hypothetical protein